MQCQLTAQVGASSFDVPWSRIREWRPVLNSAESLALRRNGATLLSLDLADPRITRWIAFQRRVSGSPFDCIGYQETVGAVQRRDGSVVVSGSNRKVLVWRRSSDGAFFIGDEPGG